MTREEYEALHAQNSKVTGYGIEGMTIHVPCPFCAAADFTSYTLPTMHEVLSNGAVCKACGRGAQFRFEHSPGVTTFGIVQTCGDDPPEYVSWIPRAKHPDP